MDDQIWAIWQALRANPDLDSRCAMDTIDRLLDQRRHGRARAAHTAQAAPSPAPGSAVQQAALASLLRILLASDSG